MGARRIHRAMAGAAVRRQVCERGTPMISGERRIQVNGEPRQRFPSAAPPARETVTRDRGQPQPTPRPCRTPGRRPLPVATRIVRSLTGRAESGAALDKRPAAAQLQDRAHGFPLAGSAAPHWLQWTMPPPAGTRRPQPGQTAVPLLAISPPNPLDAGFAPSSPAERGGRRASSPAGLPRSAPQPPAGADPPRPAPAGAAPPISNVGRPAAIAHDANVCRIDGHIA